MAPITIEEAFLLNGPVMACLAAAREQRRDDAGSVAKEFVTYMRYLEDHPEASPGRDLSEPAHKTGPHPPVPHSLTKPLLAPKALSAHTAMAQPKAITNASTTAFSHSIVRSDYIVDSDREFYNPYAEIEHHNSSHAQQAVQRLHPGYAAVDNIPTFNVGERLTDATNTSVPSKTWFNRIFSGALGELLPSTLG